MFIKWITRKKVWLILVGAIGLAFLYMWLGYYPKHTTSLVPISPPVKFSNLAISAGVEKKLSLALTSAVPELEEVYYQLLKNGDLMIVGTASLDGYGDEYSIASDMTTRFLQTAYQVSPIPVDYAALYTTYHGRYMMAAGLGRKALQEVSLTALAADQGTELMNQLVHIDNFNGALSTQAFAEYR